MPRAPRVRLRRIDAAIDALRPMGFPEPLIRKTVRNLLKVYGGDEGWTFIEEFSYKLLIDSILEEVEEKSNAPRLLENTERTLMIEDGVSKDKTNEGGSGMLVPYTNMHSNKVESSSSQLPPLKKRIMQVHNPSNSSSTLAIAVPCSLKGEISEVKHGKQIPLSKITAGCSSPQVKVCSHNKNASTEVRSQLFLPPLVESRPAQRHKPCYGWLSSDDDEEPE